MTRLCLITALPAETRPLLDAFKLRQVQAGPLRTFGAENILLLETGPGKLNAAACTAAMLQHYSDITVLLNIGIAGGNFDYGETMLAHHIQDQASGVQWYPHIPGHPAFRALHSASLCTVDKPQTDYPADKLFDMEAAAVFSAASRYLSTSQIYSVKVVSDNPRYSLEHITRQSVKALIQATIPTIGLLIDVLLAQSVSQQRNTLVGVESYVNNLCIRVNHSVNDKQQLQRLVQQYVGISGKLPDVNDADIANAAFSAKTLRQLLRTSLESQAINYGDQ